MPRTGTFSPDFMAQPESPEAATVGRMLDDLRETHVAPWETRAFRAATTGAWLLVAAGLSPTLLPDWDPGPLVFAGSALAFGLLALGLLIAHRLSQRGHAVLRRRLEETGRN